MQISILLLGILYCAVDSVEFITGHNSEGKRANYILNFVVFRHRLIIH